MEGCSRARSDVEWWMQCEFHHHAPLMAGFGR
jgi:hypothetical protein